MLLMATIPRSGTGRRSRRPATIRGVVSDQAGLYIPGSTVTAAAEDAATTRGGFTDATGLTELRARIRPPATW